MYINLVFVNYYKEFNSIIYYKLNFLQHLNKIFNNLYISKGIKILQNHKGHNPPKKRSLTVRGLHLDTEISFARCSQNNKVFTSILLANKLITTLPFGRHKKDFDNNSSILASLESSTWERY